MSRMLLDRMLALDRLDDTPAGKALCSDRNVVNYGTTRVELLDTSILLH